MKKTSYRKLPHLKSKNKLVVVLGPTASGKTDLTEKLAFEFAGEIVSADSRQVYREMNIGTNKTRSAHLGQGFGLGPAKLPWAGEVSGQAKYKVKNYLIDVVNPNENFTLSQYKKLALTAIKNIQKRSKLSFLVGGTGLYIQAIVDNLIIPEVPPDAKIRAQLELRTNEQLFNQLKKLDPACAKKIDAKNRRRLIRAIEVCLKTGRPFSQLRQKGKSLFNALQIGISVPKKELNQRIDQRVDEMIKAGLVDEVKRLMEAARKRAPVRLSPDLQIPAFSGIGYQEIIQYLQNKISLEQAVKLIKQHTKQYAKRQMTWFRRDSRIHWITKYPQAKKLIKDFLGK